MFASTGNVHLKKVHMHVTSSPGKSCEQPEILTGTFSEGVCCEEHEERGET
jgi:hypothetical protein